MKKKILIKIISISLITISIICGIIYGISLRAIKPEVEDFEQAFSGKIKDEIHSANSSSDEFKFEHKLFKGSYKITVLDRVHKFDSEYTEWHLLSDGTKIRFSGQWYYSDRGGSIFPAQYWCAIYYENDISSIIIDAQCNFPKLDGYEEFLDAIVQSINSLE